MKIIVVIAIGIIVAGTGCDLLTTREPEEPSSGSTGFPPNTTPQVVLQNFENAIKNKNITWFRSVLPDADTGFGGGGQASYTFEPSAEARQQHASLFERWSIDQEEESMNALFLSIPLTDAPVLELSPIWEVNNNSDSAVVVSDYIFVPGHTEDGLADTLAGRLSLTISSVSSGRWAVTRWIDQALGTPDATQETWSSLKAHFAR